MNCFRKGYSLTSDYCIIFEPITDSENSSDTDTLSNSESDDQSERVSDKSVVTNAAEGLSESVLKLDITK